MNRAELPDVRMPDARLRVRRTATAPGTDARESFLVLRLTPTRLHLRDEAGRSYADILADVTTERGFGRVARTMEDFMDLAAPAPSRGPTDVVVDVSAGRAAVVEGDGEPWHPPAHEVLRLADLVLTGGREQRLDAVGERCFLDRDCTEYRLTRSGTEDGVAYRTEIDWLVWGPYLLRQEARDAAHGTLSLATEVVELVEGAVTEDDPATAS